MNDIFVEYMVVRRPTNKIWAYKALIFLGALAFAILASNLLSLINMFAFSLAVVFFAGWGMIVVMRRLDLEFEYIITNGEMDIDKIMGRRIRKRLLSVDCRNFDILAPYESRHKNEYESQTISSRLDFSSHPEAEGRWFAVFNAKDGVRTLLIFEPNEKMLDAFSRYIKSKMKD